MSLKILHAADLHLDSPFSSFSEVERSRLRELQREIPEQMLKISRQYGCKIWLLAGDIFDGPYTRGTVLRLKQVFAECGASVFVAPGNHDPYRKGSPWLEEHWPDNVYVFKGDLEAVVDDELDCRVFGAGFQSMDCPPLLNGFSVGRKYRHEVCVIHGDPVNMNSPYNPVSAAAVRDSGLDYLAMGHVHSSGQYTVDSTVCAWPGCPMGRGWDETGDKGIYIAEISEHPHVEFIKLDLPGFYEISVNSEKDASIALPPVATDDHFRLILQGTGAVNPKKLESTYSYLPNLEIIDRQISMENPVELISEDSFRGVFFKNLFGQIENDPSQERMIHLAAEISQEILAGLEVELP